MKKSLLLFVLILGAIFYSSAQKFDYDNNSKIYFGFNLGRTWHTSDVANVKDRFPLGAGFIFGGSLNQDYGKALSFDLRLRYLGGAWYGQDSDTTGAIDNNTAVNSLYDTLGYATQNFRSGQHHLALELAVHANRFRERTGLDPYIFGGIGLTATQTKGDLQNNNTIYDYDLNPSGSQIIEQYDTPLDKNPAGDPYDDVEYETNFVPSLGFGLGYYFTSRFSMGFEHKSTFFMDDYFDGTILNQNGQPSDFENDIYHYTSVYFRWYLRSGNNQVTEEVVEPENTTDINSYTNTTNRNQPPLATFTNPSSSPHTTDAQSITLRADVKHVGNSNDITFRQDGITNSGFTYNPITDHFQSTVQLHVGQNIFKVKGVNEYGSDEATMIIVNRREDQIKTPTPPVVDIVDPSSNPLTVNDNAYNIKATIQHISSKQRVAVLFNGQTFTNFNFTPIGASNFNANLTLNPGVNTIKITGTNDDGTDSDETTIIYKRAPKIDPPIVNFTNPSTSPINVSSNAFNLTGTVARVQGRNFVKFIQNGTENGNFNFNANTTQFSSNVVLSPGQNIFQLIGTNDAGTDQETVVINYQVERPKPPIVSILNPSNDPHVTYDVVQAFKASVLNVSSQNQVNMTINGGNFTNFSFNPNSGILTSAVPLQLGTNIVTVTGTNNDGTDSENTTIIYRKPEQPKPPIVEFIVPSNNPFQTFDATQLINATVLNVNNKNQVSVVLNGNSVSTFSFNTTNKLTSFTATLIEGVNTVNITGSNNDGVDSKTMTIIYKKKEKPTPPIVSFIDPIVNPKVVYSPVYSVVAKVQYVDGPNDIQLKINGNVSNNFTYTNTSEQVAFNASLVLGANTIEVKGTNQFGQDIATTAIIYKQVSKVDPPQVNIVNPSMDPYTSAQSSKQVQATVLNVPNAQSVSVMINGNNLSGFSYNGITKQVSFTVNLVEGNNTIEVSATTVEGSDSDNTTIIYNKEEVIEPPFVAFTNPPSSGYVVTNPSFQMVAEVENVSSKNDIDVRFNGSLINSNLFNFNAQTKEVTYAVSLTGGNNLFQVKGTNTAGSHQATTNVIFNEPDLDCENPEVNYTAPSNSGVVVNTDFYNMSAIVSKVSSQGDIKLLVNGIEISSFMFNPVSGQVVRKIDLMEGNNVVEIIASNDCGKVDETILINYVIKDAPCVKPEITSISPADTDVDTEQENLNFSAGLTNIDNAQQLKLIVNGVQTNFDFDLGTHEILATLDLKEGNNTIVVIATNECGKAKMVWNINRKVCEQPEIILVTDPASINGPLPNSNLKLSGTIKHTTNSEIQVLFNGNPVNFVYNQITGSFNMSIQLAQGGNTINIKAVNDCGVAKKEFKVSHKPIVIPEPPSVSITVPVANPHTTTSANQNITATTTNISSSNQINVSLNGASTNFNFDAATGMITFNAGLQVGTNTVSVTVVNNDGSASDDTQIIYKKPVIVKRPVVSYSSPDASPKEVAAGNFNVSGFVTNLNAVGQMEVLVNQQPYSAFTTSVQNNGIGFSFDLLVDTNNDNFDITVIGINSAGSHQKSVTITLKEDETNCMPNVSGTFSADHKSATANSSLDLSNVVLKFSDQTTQKFESLSGNTITLSGTGNNQGKCIIGIWVKSGCNSSGDGPGYGQWIPNTDYDGSCETQPCDTPVISLMSEVESTQENYNLVISVDHVTANQVNIKHNGQPINCNYTSGNQYFNCSVSLIEGTNTFVVTANGCDTVSQTYSVQLDIPCDPITFNRTFPAQASEVTTTDNITIALSAQNATSTQVIVNGANYTNFSVSGNQITLNNVPLNEGSNTIQVILSNNCSQESVNYGVTYNAPQSCGPRINPGNSAWQFCLVTPSGTYTRDDLANNPNFNYTGSASSLYIKAIAGGGDAIVNGNNYSIQPGKYYLFEGNLNVSVSTSHPGSMGHWQVCIESNAVPKSGNGGNRPNSPCEAKKVNTNNSGGARGGETTRPNNTINKPTRKEPQIRKEEEQRKAPTRTKPTREEPSRNSQEPSKSTIKEPENSGGEPTKGSQPTRGGQTRTRVGSGI
jgi:hypothetical protein